MWEFIEQISCITTDNSSLYEGLNKNLKHIGVKNFSKYTFKAVGKDNTNDNCDLINTFRFNEHCCGTVCSSLFDNHLKVIQDAYYSNKNNILILEDDARFVVPFDYIKLKRIFVWLEENEWDIFYFGSINWPILINIPVTDDIARSFTPLLGHSVLISRDGMEKIINSEKKNIQIDKFYQEVLDKKYVCYPNINFQDKPPKIYKDAINKLPLDYIGLNDFTKTCQAFNFISYYSTILIFIVTFMLFKR